jgi:hypothetical protein
MLLFRLRISFFFGPSTCNGLLGKPHTWDHWTNIFNKSYKYKTKPKVGLCRIMTSSVFAYVVSEHRRVGQTMFFFRVDCFRTSTCWSTIGVSGIWFFQNNDLFVNTGLFWDLIVSERQLVGQHVICLRSRCWCILWSHYWHTWCDDFFVDTTTHLMNSSTHPRKMKRCPCKGHRSRALALVAHWLLLAPYRGALSITGPIQGERNKQEQPYVPTIRSWSNHRCCINI